MCNDFLVVSLDFAHQSLDLDVIEAMSDEGICSVCPMEIDPDDAWVVASPVGQLGGFIQDPEGIGWLAGKYIAMLTHRTHIEKCKERLNELKNDLIINHWFIDQKKGLLQ